jgi:hypothetical protein
MMHRTLHLLLALLILGCPLWCKAGACSVVDACCDHGVAVAETCHEGQCGRNCFDGHEDGSNPLPPTPPQDSPCGKCQCICSGALVEHGDPAVDQLTEMPLDSVLVASDLIAATLFRQDARSMQSPCERSSPGRNLCILHSSFLL